MSRIRRIGVRVAGQVARAASVPRLLKMSFEDAVRLVPNDGFNRIPIDRAGRLSRGVRRNSKYPAGKAVEFKTSSQSFCIDVFYAKREHLGNMDGMGTSGVDVYRRDGATLKWVKCVYPTGALDMHASEYVHGELGFSEYVLYLPSYADVHSIWVTAEDEPPRLLERAARPLLLAYGSSITQGCAASRPGLNYVNVLGRMLDMDVRNLGFSESAKGEVEMAQYVAGQHAAVFIMEYDHNASVAELEETHLPFYECVRAENPDSQIVFLSRLSGGVSISLSEAKQREETIANTVRVAASRGDRKVHFLKGSSLALDSRKGMLVDDRHPNDQGMRYIAEQIARRLEAF